MCHSRVLTGSVMMTIALYTPCLRFLHHRQIRAVKVRCLRMQVISKVRRSLAAHSGWQNPQHLFLVGLMSPHSRPVTHRPGSGARTVG